MTKKIRKIAISQWGHSGYWEAIERAGGKTYIINEDTLLSKFDNVAGLVIPGGRDISPVYYGEELGKYTQIPDKRRDAAEIAFIDRALSKNIPILGVCRGHQVLNVAMGGTLIQHLSGHVGMKHEAFISEDAVHLKFLEENKLFINSLHHQAIGKVGKGLRVTAMSHDGVVEAVESTQHDFAVGVQWHPEMRLNPVFDREMGKLWKKFVGARQ